MTTRIHVEIDEITLKRLILDHLSILSKTNLLAKDIKIEVKSKQNYRSEWEEANFRAIVNKVDPE